MLSEGRSTVGRILVVEDEAIIAADLAEALVDLGYEVVATVDTAEDAIVLAADQAPDIVLMDVRLAGAMDGIAAAATIKERADIPVIFLTAHSDDDTLQRARVVQPHAYLVKPFRASELRGAIERALEIHRAARRGAARERWLAAMAHPIGDAIIATDPAGRITALNRVAAALTGWPEADALGAALEDVMCLVDEHSGARVPCPARAAAETGVGVTLRGVGLAPRRAAAATSARAPQERAAERAPRLDLDAQPRRGPSGDALGAVVVARDRAEHARVEEALRQLGAEVRARVIDWGGGSPAGAAPAAAAAPRPPGELRVRPRGTDGLGQLFGAPLGGLAPERAEDLRRIEVAAPRLGELFSGLLHLVDAARAELRLATVDLTAIAREVAAALGLGRVARVRVQDGLVAVGDRRLLRCALGHLLANAGRATMGAMSAVIEVVATAQGGERIFEVRDNGVGFPPAQAPHLFRAFHRAAGAGEPEGVGLGLAIVERIVHRHGGRVWATGEEGRGASFSFSLGTGTGTGTGASAGTSASASASAPAAPERAPAPIDSELARAL